MMNENIERLCLVAVVPARDHRQVDACVVEEIAQHHPVAQAAGQPIEAVDRDVIDLPRGEGLDQTPQRRPVEGAAADTDVVEPVGQADPPLRTAPTANVAITFAMS